MLLFPKFALAYPIAWKKSKKVFIKFPAEDRNCRFAACRWCYERAGKIACDLSWVKIGVPKIKENWERLYDTIE